MAMRHARGLFRVALAVMALAMAQGAAVAADKVRIVAQRTGTLAWELDVARHHGLDQQAGLTFETVMLASPMAQKVAIKGATADVIVADWIWVARERALGGNLLFYPYSSTAGALMVPPGSPLKTLGDLRDRSIGVGGDAIDKSWILVRALAARGLDPALPVMRAHGVPGVVTYLRGEASLEAAIQKGKTDTRHYSKRQFTFVRHQLPEFVWAAPEAAEQAVSAMLHR